MKLGGKNVSNTLYIGTQRPFTSADKQNLDANTSARHTHDNKTVLDGITAEKIEQWDAGGSGGGSGETNVQPDWEQTDTEADDYIKNKPDLTLKEDTSNKITSLSSASTDEQYPSAKATVDYVKQTTSALYDYKGTITYSGLQNASVDGKGVLYNTPYDITKTFTETDIGDACISTDTSYTLHIYTDYTLPGVVTSFILHDKDEGVDYTVSTSGNHQVMRIGYNARCTGETSYKDFRHKYRVSSYLPSSIISKQKHNFYIKSMTYNLSVSAGDSIISTGYYWDKISLLDILSIKDGLEGFAFYFNNFVANQTNLAMDEGL